MTSLSILESVRAQVKAVLAEIEHIEGAEFPYLHSKEGLEEIKQIFSEHLNSLYLLNNQYDEDTIELACLTAFSVVAGSLEILGFILRSTNVRNAFEIYGPLLRISQKILGPDTKLIISSEWNFSPFTFTGYEYLPNFVLIGLPASESANPFLIPLAGHELGHTIWSVYSCNDLYRQPLKNNIIANIIENHWSKYSDIFPNYSKDELDTNLMAQQTWGFALNWAMQQSQELFCDFIGLMIFGESYLHAFSYLIGPWRAGSRSCEYPNLIDRAKALVEASKIYNFSAPKNYVSMFKDLEEPCMDRQFKFNLLLADAARSSILDQLIVEAKEIVSSKIPTRSPELIMHCKQAFRLMVPVQNAVSLSNILNAAWEALLDQNFFPDIDHNKEKQEYLKEIVLKSIEVFEIEARIKE